MSPEPHAEPQAVGLASGSLSPAPQAEPQALGFSSFSLSCMICCSVLINWQNENGFGACRINAIDPALRHSSLIAGFAIATPATPMLVTGGLTGHKAGGAALALLKSPDQFFLVH